jgi:hypothetical protein
MIFDFLDIFFAQLATRIEYRLHRIMKIRIRRKFPIAEKKIKYLFNKLFCVLRRYVVTAQLSYYKFKNMPWIRRVQSGPFKRTSCIANNGHGFGLRFRLLVVDVG